MERRRFFTSVFDTKTGTDEDSDRIRTDDLCLNMALPMSIAGCIHYRAMQKYKEENETFQMCYKMTENIQISTGSSTDGCSLPGVTEIKRSKRVTEGCDEDIMYLATSLIVDNENKRAFCSTESACSSPGFTKLVFNKDWLDKRKPSKIHRERCERGLIERNFQRFVANHGKPYIHRRILLRILRTSIREMIHSANSKMDLIKCFGYLAPDISFSHHGPAITVDRSFSIDHVSSVNVSKDYVIALPVPRWPKEASEWVTRSRVWPDKQLVRQIVNGGCNIVLKGDAVYDNPRDCLISFSKCEKQLGLSLKIKQKRCYILFKYLFKYAINKANRGLSTYHCKTIFYHRCEKVPAERWVETSLVEGLIWLLEDMDMYLRDGVLPQFFIPEMNLIGRCTDRQKDAILRDLSIIKQNPVRLIVDLTKTRKFSWISEDRPLTDVLYPVLSDTRVDKEKAQLVLVQFLESLLDKGMVSVAISILCDTDNADIMPNTTCIIKSVEHAVQTYAGSNSVPLKGILATVYLQRALESSDKDVQLLQQPDYKRSRELFESVKNDIQHHIWIHGEYMNLLYKVGEYCEIINHYDSLMNCTDGNNYLYTKGIYTTIASHNRLTVEQTFQDIIELAVPSVVYITYRTILACTSVAGFNKEVSNTSDIFSRLTRFANKLVARLESWLKEKRQIFPEYTDESIYFLIGLLHKSLGNEVRLHECFKVAEDFNGIYGEVGDDLIDEPKLTDEVLKHKADIDIESAHGWSTNTSQRKRRKDIRKLDGLKFRSKRLKLNAFTHF